MNNLKKIKTIAEKCTSIDGFLLKIKRKNLCYDIDALSDCRSYLCGRYGAAGDEKLNELLNEVLFFKREREALKARISKLSAFSSPEEEFVYALMVLEFISRRKNVDGNVEDSGFGFDVKINTSFQDGINYRGLVDEEFAFDYFLQNYSGILKELWINVKSDLLFPNAMDWGKFRTAFECATLASDWAIFNEFQKLWEINEVTITVDGGQAILNAQSSGVVAAFRVSLARLRLKRFSRDADIIRRVSSSHSRLLKRWEENTVVSFYHLVEQFYSRDLKENYLGVALNVWLKSYSLILRLINENSLKKDCFGLFFTVSKTDLLKLLSNEGIDKSDCEFVVSSLTFTNKSTDILDCPLILVSPDRYAILKSCASVIHPAFSIESLLRSKGADFQSQGNKFQNNILKFLQGKNIPCATVKVKNFDCDVAFIFDDDLYLCECKSKFQQENVKGYREYLEGFLLDTVAQHKKTTDFFVGNLSYIRKELSLDANWNPVNIHKLIVTSALLGRSLRVNDFYILDEKTLKDFFSRAKMRKKNVVTGAIIEEYYDERLEGL
ncbi:hypothetical protein [Chromobacterium sp. Beijing]|uniref:hypothetical protein n=1 Tax=Chromobacterium sp. Beijing TaxID=2735795 RepID=UPI001F30CBAD|nr:hypothetical protein [Chromobacterium sp. Beijing]UJB30499.1 hypothetical protein HQN78_05125 [Chromobacterium sp. Beijing]